ncbi:hypothetical protein LTR36_007628 [Oleoguttula mirabilis]|uniref:Death domain-containing protein n=1 Tax=Oleoguttula mirabilis TaxID=1507867 RepID=A0AAV9JUB0_9PEZI|nr:hypothetical protein LTR36_007628 [Oleoguttula mirabilis]
MPFEFTGKSLTFSGNANTFASLSAPSDSQSTSASTPSFGSFASFGTSSSSPWSAHAARSAAPSPSPIPTTEAHSTLAQGREKQVDDLVQREKDLLDSAPGTDALMQALRRAVNCRPAVFGQAAVASDRVVGSFIDKAAAEFDRTAAQTSAQLSSELRAALAGKPLAVAFVDHLLAEATGQETLGTLARNTAPTPRTDGSLSFSIQGRPSFARGSPAFLDIVSKMASELKTRDLLKDDAGNDVETMASRLAKELGSGAILSEVQRALELAAGRGTFDAECGTFIDWALRMIDEVVYGDKLGTVGPAGVAGRRSPVPAIESTVTECKSSVSAAKVLAKQEPPQSLTTQEVAPFRFLDLPPELRVWVYRKLLAPGHISLRSCANNQLMAVSLGVTPNHLAPKLLRAGKLIHKEACDMLYAENTICINVSLLFGCEPMIAKRQVPNTTLPRLKSVMLMFDTVSPNDMVVNALGHCDWRQLAGMMGLTHARICMIERDNLKDRADHRSSLLEHLIERLPANCKLAYGAEGEAEQQHVRGAMAHYLKSGRYTHYNLTCYEVAAEVLEQAAKGLSVEQGCKSGHARDYRYPTEGLRDFSSLKPLVSEGDVDESVVLGR